MNAHITQSLQLERARRAAFAPFVMPLRLPLFSQVPGALIFLTLLGALALPNIAAAGVVFDVNDLRDLSDKPGSVGDGLCETEEGTCTLRAAMEEFSTFECDFTGSNLNHINLPAGTYTLTRSSPLEITHNEWSVCIEIQGTLDSNGLIATVIDGNSPTGRESDPRFDSVFHVPSKGTLILNGVSITQGHHHFIGGGAIRNEGNLRIHNSLLTKNSTHGKGGAIYSTRYVFISKSTISDNWSRPNFPDDFDGDGKSDRVAGGAIANVGGGVLMYNVTISGNLGGLDPDGVWSKEGDGGGAILNVGGGIITMISTTVAHNLTIRESGGGIYNDPESYAEIFYTIVAKNYYYKNRETLALAANDCKGTLESFGYNLVGVEGSSCTVPPGPGDKLAH